MTTKRNGVDRVLNIEEAKDLIQMEQKEIEKAQAYLRFFEECKQRLDACGGKLPAEEQKIIDEKHSALLEKYGYPHNATTRPSKKRRTR